MLHRIARPRDVVLRKSVVALIGLFAIMALLLLDAPPVSANSTETYVVVPGDRFYSLARRYCTSWDELYNLNRHIVGPNPDYLQAGTTITVIDRCGSGSGGGGSSGIIHGDGRTAHAQGKLVGNKYYVVYGDTVYSIAKRFGVNQAELEEVNRLHSPYDLKAGQTLTIPGIGGVIPPPPRLTITQPTSGAYLPPTFTVSGSGFALYEGNVVVQAKDSHANVLVEHVTTLQGNNMGTGGQGSYSVSLTVNASPNTPGQIVVYSPGTTAKATVPVVFNGVTLPVLTIEYPTSGSNVQATFTVSGRGAGLYDGNLVVQAKDAYGTLLAERTATLQVSNGGTGSYSTQLTVNVAANTPGTIVVYSPGSPGAYATTSVRFNTPPEPFVVIESPVNGSLLPATFTVSGRGAGLYEGNVVVQARDLSERVLQQQPATLQGYNVGTGGEGVWSVQMTVNEPIDGRIVAYSSSPIYVESSVSVRYNSSEYGPGPSTPVKDFAPGECRVTPQSGAPYYGYPDGPQIGQFSGANQYNVIRGVYTAGSYWYYVDIAPGTTNPSVWVKGSDLTVQQGSCTW